MKCVPKRMCLINGGGKTTYSLNGIKKSKHPAFAYFSLHISQSAFFSQNHSTIGYYLKKELPVEFFVNVCLPNPLGEIWASTKTIILNLFSQEFLDNSNIWGILKLSTERKLHVVYRGNIFFQSFLANSFQSISYCKKKFYQSTNSWIEKKAYPIRISLLIKFLYPPFINVNPLVQENSVLSSPLKYAYLRTPHLISSPVSNPHP